MSELRHYIQVVDTDTGKGVFESKSATPALGFVSGGFLTFIDCNGGTPERPATFLISSVVTRVSTDPVAGLETNTVLFTRRVDSPQVEAD